MEHVVTEVVPELAAFRRRYRAALAHRRDRATIQAAFDQRAPVMLRCLQRARHLAQRTSSNTVIHRQVLADDVRELTQFLGVYEAHRLLANTETSVWSLEG